MYDSEPGVIVLLVTGFLESGKTSLINSTVRDEYFAMDEPTLLINCERGECTYSPEDLKKYSTDYVQITTKEEFTPERLKELDRQFNPGRVIIEYNPLWGIPGILGMRLPNGWEIVQKIALADASTFKVYLANMKSIFADMARAAEIFIINRCVQEMDLASMRRSIKILNPACQVLFEAADRKPIDSFKEFLPYDMDADPIVVEDMDFGILYMDIRDNFEKYEGKNVRFKGQVLKSRERNAKYFVPGREAMVCCADDTTFIGYVCESRIAPKLAEGSWVDVTGRIVWKYSKPYRDRGPVIEAAEIKPADPPESLMIYFN